MNGSISSLVKLMKYFHRGGICHFGNPTFLYFCRFGILVGFLIMQVMSQLARLVISLDNMPAALSAIRTAISYASCAFRAIYFNLYGAKARQIADTLVHELSYVSMAPKANGNYQGWKTKAIWVYTSFCLSSIVLSLANPILSYIFIPTVKQLPLVLNGWYPFDLNKEPNHTLVFLSHCFGTSVICVFYFIDIYIFTIQSIFIKQFKLTADWYQKVTDDFPADGPFTVAQEEKIYERLMRGIKHHQLLQRLMADFYDTVRPLMLTNIATFVVTITFLLFNIVVALDTKKTQILAFLFNYFCLLISLLFIYCKFGDMLTEKAEEFLTKLLNIPWYNMLHHKKLRFAMLMSVHNCVSKPTQLVIAKIYKVDLEFFNQICNTIYPVFTLLLEFRSGDED